MSLAPGDKLGPYEIVSALGAGGMGEVWKARDTRLGRIVAIKRIKSEYSARFVQEAQAIAAVNHLHICQIYDIGPDYLVLEYIEGQPLKGPIAADEVVRLALQVTGALEEAHARGILHRDLKPANILLTAKGAKLLDFGLATLTVEADATRTAGVVGTPLHMSPEQAEGRVLDARSDIFSLGTVLYEMVAGRRPFDSLAAVLRDEPRALDAPSGLREIINRCLRKSPSERFASAADVRIALERAGVKPAEPRSSIAVLPFANLSRDPDDEYFSDGLAEELSNALGKVPGLKVIARTSSFAFKGQNTDIRKVADILGVTNVLEGSVRRAGNRIRVTAQLIEAGSGTQLWSERYDRQMEDIFAMQDEIAAAILLQLKLTFAPAAAAQPRRQPNVQAYEAYLRYLHLQWRFTPESLRRSRECLEQAIALDPGFALPYAGLADHHLASTMAGVHPDVAMPLASTLAQRALELDPDLPEAHGMLAIVAGPHALDWQEAERRFRLAMAHEPVPWHVREWYAVFYLLSVGRAEEARREVDRALQDNPLDQITLHAKGSIASGLGLDEEARAAFEKLVALDPQFWWGWCQFGMHCAVRGKHREARECADKAFAIFPSSPLNIGLMAGLCRGEDSARAEALLAQLPSGAYGTAHARTFFHLAQGEIDAALDWAGKAVGDRDPSFIPIVVRTFEKWLRHSPGWPAFLKTINLTS